MKHRMVCLAGVLVFAMSAHAASTTYSGADGDWAVPASWSAGLPVAGDTAVIQNERQMYNFDGQSVGVINSTGKRLYLYDTATLTMNNLGSTATITAGPFSIGNGTVTPTLAFTDDLTITTNELTMHVGSIIQGSGTLTLVGSTRAMKFYTGSTIDVDRLDVSNFGYIRSYNNGGGGSLNGVTVYTGGLCVFNMGTNGNSYSGLNGASLEMDSAYALFGSNISETLTIDTWKVGSTYLTPGTYNAASGIVDGVDMGVVFGSASSLSMTVTAVPEPATMGLLALGGLAILKRRRHQK